MSDHLSRNNNRHHIPVACQFRSSLIVPAAEDISPAADPAGKLVDPVQGHLTNLTCPSSPFFFNTLYDPYRAGADFVRGYPFSLREGTATVVSHGLWLNRMGACRHGCPACMHVCMHMHAHMCECMDAWQHGGMGV